MVIATTDLLNLIGSMSKSEKGYFKKFVKGFGAESESNYILLFDYLDKNPGADDDTVVTFFKKKKIEVHLRMLRPYLWQMLMRALRVYNEEKSVRFEIRNRLQDMEILLSKNLTREAIKLIDESIELCNEHNQDDYAIIFLQYRHYLAGYYDWENQRAIQPELVSHIINKLKQIEQKVVLKDLDIQLTFFSNKHFPLKEKSIIDSYAKFMVYPIMADEDAIIGIPAKLAFYHIKKNWFRLISEYETALEYQVKTVRLLEENPQFLKNAVATYIKELYEEAGLFLHVGKPDDAVKALDTLLSYATVNPIDSNFRRRFYYQGILKILKLYPHNYPHLKAIVPDIENFISQANYVYEAEKLITYFDIAVFYFSINNYNKALDWLNPVLNLNPKGNVAYQVHTRLLNIIIHYELKNMMMLPALLRNTYRLMLKMELKLEFEKSLLSFIRRLLMRINEDELNHLFSQFRQELISIRDVESQGSPFQMFDYAGWLDSKLIGKAAK
jgi:tetratricopeptide (TPR) repeat protein